MDSLLTVLSLSLMIRRVIKLVMTKVLSNLFITSCWVITTACILYTGNKLVLHSLNNSPYYERLQPLPDPVDVFMLGKEGG